MNSKEFFNNLRPIKKYAQHITKTAFGVLGAGALSAAAAPAGRGYDFFRHGAGEAIKAGLTPKGLGLGIGGPLGGAALGGLVGGALGGPLGVTAGILGGQAVGTVPSDLHNMIKGRQAATSLTGPAYMEIYKDILKKYLPYAAGAAALGGLGYGAYKLLSDPEEAVETELLKGEALRALESGE
jgi:hypothetical protein